MKNTGSFTFVIYSHIPYVTSPDRSADDVNRLHQATSECYIPLLNTLARLVDEGISPKVVVGFSPLLTEMVSQDAFKDDFVAYMEGRIGAAEKDLVEFEKLGKKQLTMIARMWREFYSFILDDFTAKFKGDILKPFADMESEGHIELITTAATGGYLPLLSRDESIHAQMSQAAACHKRHFGKAPRGMWLPEHGYRPGGPWQSPIESGDTGEPSERGGIENFSGSSGIDYLITDTHLLNGDEPPALSLDTSTSLSDAWKKHGGNLSASDSPDRSPYTTYQLCGADSETAPLTLFTRDPLTGSAVAGLKDGYPTDGSYLDFFRRQRSSNLRYWRVTGGGCDLVEKEEYHPDQAFSGIAANSTHFTKLVRETLSDQRRDSGKAGIVVSLFNATIFGQRWFEGHEWLYHTIASLAQEEEIKRVTTGEYMDKGRPSEVTTLSEGSSAGRGNHKLLLNDGNRWMWQRLYEAEEEMVDVVNDYGDINDNLNLENALRQAGRELLLLQSSDWPRLANAHASRAFAEARFIRHFEDFKRLADIARHVGREGALRKHDWAFMQLCMERDDIFPEIEPLWFKAIRKKEQAL
ncbi:MAG: 1,4-alpha-glucan branching protein domain-containing protein [Thermodesulfobacteriota bacterium]